jgi:hypothetical protein
MLEQKPLNRIGKHGMRLDDFATLPALISLME